MDNLPQIPKWCTFNPANWWNFAPALTLGCAQIQLLELAGFFPDWFDIDIWFGLVFGLLCSTSFWLSLRHLRPEAFVRDRIARSLWGRALYATAPFLILMVIYAPSLVGKVENAVAQIQVIKAADKLLQSDEWTEAGALDEEQQNALILEARALIAAIKWKKQKGEAFYKLALNVADWGDVSRSRNFFAKAVKAAPDIPSVVESVLASQIRRGDYLGAHITCLRGYAGQLCLEYLSDHLRKHDLPLSKVVDMHKAIVIIEWNGPDAARLLMSGSKDAAFELIEECPKGLVRAEALADMGTILLEHGHEAAAAMFERAYVQTSLDLPELKMTAGSDIVYLKISNAWYRHGALEAARTAANRIEDPKVREKQLQKLSNSTAYAVRPHRVKISLQGGQLGTSGSRG
jgi:hypothetical protein